MIACEKCGAKYPTERLFCGKCKHRLGIRCPMCGFINLMDDRFCGICLTELRAQGEIPVAIQSTEPVFLEIFTYDEIQTGALEDEAFASIDGKLEQEEIDNFFQDNDGS